MEETINGTSVSLIRSWIFYLLDLIKDKNLNTNHYGSKCCEQQLKPEVVLILKIIEQTLNGQFTWRTREGSHPILTDDSAHLKEQLNIILKVIDIKNP